MRHGTVMAFWFFPASIFEVLLHLKQLTVNKANVMAENSLYLVLVILTFEA